MKKLLITGANGCLGRLIPNIKGYEVIRTDRDTLDITDFKQVDRFMEENQPRVVIHLASLLGSACDDKELAMRVNVEATEHLFSEAQKYLLDRFIFTSSCAVYNQQELKPTSELENLGAESMYGITKFEAEQRLFGNPEVTIFRIFNMYGEGFENSLVNRFKGSEKLTLCNPNTYYRDYIWASDVVKYIIKAIQIDKGGVYNLGSGVVRSTADLLRTFEEMGIEPNYEVRGDGEVTISWADISKLKRVFGGFPQKDLVI